MNKSKDISRITENSINIVRNEYDEQASVILRTAEKDKYVPDDFYSTTNHKTSVYYNSSWHQVQNQRMDAMIVIDDKGAYCKKLRDIKKGDMVVCGDSGISVHEKEIKEEDQSFGFMSNSISSERRNELLIKDLAFSLFSRQKKVAIVAGPVIVHTGGDVYLMELIRRGMISSLLCGNAVAVHDIEKNLYGTSLGVCSKSGRCVPQGYKNHMRAINQVMRYGSIEAMANAGALKSGIMYECVKNSVPFVLAGSLRDDGPLPDTITDMISAQNAYHEQLKDADTVIIAGSMLHGIATGNMLPSRVEMICIDINPAVVTKLSDRGSGQAVGIVTDVGLFFKLLVAELDSLSQEYTLKDGTTNL